MTGQFSSSKLMGVSTVLARELVESTSGVPWLSPRSKPTQALSMNQSQGNQLKPTSTMLSYCGNRVSKTSVINADGLRCIDADQGLVGVLKLVVQVGVEPGRPAIIRADLRNNW